MRYLALLVYVICLFACSKETTCGNITQQVEVLEDISNCLETNEELVNDDQPIYVINSPSEMQSLNSCAYPIDFSLHTLVLGTLTVQGSIEKTDYNLEYSCDDGLNYLYISHFVDERITTEKVTFAILIPKVPNPDKLRVSTAIL